MTLFHLMMSAMKDKRSSDKTYDNALTGVPTMGVIIIASNSACASYGVGGCGGGG